MAINPDDFIFHSDLTPRQEVFTKTVDVAIGGGIGAGAQLLFQSAPIPMGSALQDIDIYIKFPGAVYAPNTSNSTFQGPVEVSLTADSAVGCFASTVQNGSNITCVLGCLNAYGYATTIPAKTITFTIVGYLPPSL